MNRLYGILPTFRRTTALANALSRVAVQRRGIDHLIVVDNSPGPASRSVVERFSGNSLDIEYLPSPENLGVAGGLARGMERVLETAQDDNWIVVFDDDDPLPWDSVLGELEEFGIAMVERDPSTASVGLVGGRFDWRRGRLVRVGDQELEGPVSVDFIGGNHFPFYRVSALRDVGGFSKDIFFGLEEIELGLRLRKSGYSIHAHGDLWRKRRAEAGRLGLDVRPTLRLSEPNWRRYYSLRNVIYILRRHGHIGAAVRVTVLKGLGKPLANMVHSPRHASHHLKLNLKAIRDGWCGNMGRTVEPDGGPRPGD